MYSCMFMKLYIRLPFDEFMMGVLCMLNVAPMQLHPNSLDSLCNIPTENYLIKINK